MTTTLEPFQQEPGAKHVGRDAQEGWLRLAVRLVVATMLYNVAEAVIALASGIAAGSVALVGFGLDSVIETAAASVLLWRLRLEARGADPESVERAEASVRRFVGGTFIALAIYVSAYSVWALSSRVHPNESLLGIAVALASLLIMPLISWGKIRAAMHLGSASLLAEAKETLACSYLSLTLLLGLVANAGLGWWWADPMAGLLMVPWLMKEGIEGLKGEDCC